MLAPGRAGQAGQRTCRATQRGAQRGAPAGPPAGVAAGVAPAVAILLRRRRERGLAAPRGVPEEALRDDRGHGGRARARAGGLEARGGDARRRPLEPREARAQLALEDLRALKVAI